MTHLWENTLTRILRDSQWLRHTKDGGRGLPVDVLQLLAGEAEILCGDALFSSNSRFFVIELKSSEFDISSEWLTTSGAPKAMFSYLRKVVSRVPTDVANSKPSRREKRDAELIELSLRGHHFFYVDPAKAGISRINGWVEPYLLATARKSAGVSSALAMPALPRMHRLAWTDEGSQDTFIRVPLNPLMDRDGHVIVDTSRNQDFKEAKSIGTLGLSMTELNAYLRYLSLADDAGGEEIRSVVMDDSGNLFGLVWKLSGFNAIRKFIEGRSLDMAGATPVVPSAGSVKILKS